MATNKIVAEPEEGLLTDLLAADAAPARPARVTSRPIRAPRSADGIPAGILAWAFGLPLWVIGAKYTMDGWIVALNAVATWLTLPAQLPRPSGWWVLLCIPAGLVYSWVEVAKLPGAPRVATLRRWAVTVVLWAAAILTDLGSTALGLAYPGADAWPVFLWMSQSATATALVTVALTFLPEVLMVAGMKWIRGR